MPQPNFKVTIIAGEESGDIHAASLIRELTTKLPNIELTGIGGRHMQAAGVTLISDLAKYGVTGLSEVIRHFFVIRKAFNDIKTHLTATKPDLLILVDYPGFNLRLAKFAKEVLNLRILYYISPQIWAWKPGRINTIRNTVDHMAVILPFEKAIYEKANIPASFVGHPLTHKIAAYEQISITRTELNLPENKRLIAMLPGSRLNEIEYLMPVLRDTAIRLNQQFNDLHFVIPIAGTIDQAIIKAYFKHIELPITFIEGQSINTVACSDCVVVASGTASLECALLNKPMCIIYKASRLTYYAAMKLIRVKYLGLCNLLQNQMIAPELLQHDCNAHELTIVLGDLLNDHHVKQRMTSRLQQLKLSLSDQSADCTIGSLVIKTLEI